MLNSTRNIFSWTQEAVAFLIGGRPVSGVPVRVITATEEPGNNNRLIHLKAAASRCCPEGVGMKETSEVRFEIRKRILSFSFRSEFFLPLVKNFLLDEGVVGTLSWGMRKEG
jgi:hypothetical protein